MATGYEQIRSIVAYMNEDFEGAKDVRLELPETGVCNSELENDSCCGKSDNKVSVVNNKTSCETEIKEGNSNLCCSITSI